MSDTQRAGGHKANLNNPNTSEESKQHSRDMLEGDLKDAAQRAGHGSQEGKNPGNGMNSLPNLSIWLTSSRGWIQSNFEESQCQR